MENKEDKQDSESSSGSDEAAHLEDADILPPYQSLPSAKLRKKFSLPYTAIIMLLVFVGGAVGGFFLHKKQERYRGEMLTRMDQLDSKLSGLEADRKARKALRREFAVFQGDTAEAIKKQKKAVNNLKGELSRLRQAMERQQTFEIAEVPEESSIDGYEEGDAEDEEIAEAPSNQTHPKNRVKRSKETQKYIDLVESTFQKFIRLVSEGAVNIWGYFADLIGKYTKS